MKIKKSKKRKVKNTKAKNNLKKIQRKRAAVKKTTRKKTKSVSAPLRKKKVKKAAVKKKTAVVEKKKTVKKKTVNTGKAAENMFNKIHGKSKASSKIVNIKHSPEIVALGKLDSVVYEQNGKRYVHKFGADKPHLAVSPEGRQLYVAGGKYSVNQRGIINKK